MKLTFTFDLSLNETQEKIIKEIKWHVNKVYNILNYSIREGKREINFKGGTNEEMYKIYKEYREKNWHSEYLHSHTLEQIILNCIRDHKSYLAIKEMYERGEKEIKGKPQMPRYKNGEAQITFTKQGIRVEGREIKLSISKKMQEKFKVKSLNFLIPKKLEKLINLEGLFKTNSGKIINADINGALNILRKYIKEIFSPNLEIAMDIGREQRPIKKRVA